MIEVNGVRSSWETTPISSSFSRSAAMSCAFRRSSSRRRPRNRSSLSRRRAPWPKTLVSARLPRDNTMELLERRQAGLDLLEAVVPERLHPRLLRGEDDCVVRRTDCDEVPEVVADREELEDPDPPAVSAAAIRAAACTEERRGGGGHVAGPKPREDILRRRIGLTAIKAKLSGQALADHAGKACADDIRLDSHLDQARHGARRVVRVQRRQEKVAREGGAECKVRGLR